jgi:hemerythrin
VGEGGSVDSAHETASFADMDAMALFTWHPRFAVGLPQVDAEHMRLFALADELHAAVAQGASKKSIQAVLATLIDQARAHFAHEERLMLQSGCPDFQEHKAEHERLTEKALGLQREFLLEQDRWNAEALRSLYQWLTSHVVSRDRTMAVYLGSGNCPAA